jgi:signal transduction histidine kinase
MKRQENKARLWIPLLILVTGVCLTILLWRSLERQEHTEVRRVTAQEIATVRNSLNSRMRARLDALIRLASRVTYWGNPTQELWSKDVSLLEQHLPGYQVIEWVDPSMRIKLIAPMKGNEHLADSSLAADAAQARAFERARDERKVILSNIGQSDRNRLGFTVHIPAFKNGQFIGEVTGVFRAADIFDAIIGDMEAEDASLRGYSFSIHNNGQEVYSHVRDNRELEKQWSESAVLNIQDTQWTLKVWPTTALFNSLQSALPLTALAGGIVTSILLALAVHLALLARWHARHGELINAELREEIAERHRVEAALRDTTGQLERSNRELQDFASVASHDLQEPLRKIQAFGDRLEVKCGPQMGAEGRDYLKRMHGAAGRMRRLIEDLLTFSRVTTRAQPFESVDLSKIAVDVLEDLETRIEQTGGRVEVDPLPTVEADPLQMRQLIQNLIGNGLKFQKPDEPPSVHVTGEIRRDETTDAGATEYCLLSVRDDGIGFDERYLDRIFTVFQRLHSRSEYAGTGVGLAICRKIVERHGGTITARSTPGEGAEFIVRLPLKQPQAENQDHGTQNDDDARQADHDTSGG